MHPTNLYVCLITNINKNPLTICLLQECECYGAGANSEKDLNKKQTKQIKSNFCNEARSEKNAII